MNTATIIAAAAAALVIVVVIVFAVVLRRQQRHHREELAQVLEASRAETAGLNRRIDDLVASQESLRARATSAGLLITDAGEPVTQVEDRVVVSATLGAPLVKAAATAHGLRRALSPETRNRIFFEMRREVRRARKQRKREMRAAWRDARTGVANEERVA